MDVTKHGVMMGGDSGPVDSICKKWIAVGVEKGEITAQDAERLGSLFDAAMFTIARNIFIAIEAAGHANPLAMRMVAEMVVELGITDGDIASFLAANNGQANEAAASGLRH